MHDRQHGRDHELAGEVQAREHRASVAVAGDGGFLAGTGYVLTAGALKVLSGSSDAVGLDTFVTFVRTMIANVHDTGSIVSVIDPSSGWIERGVFVFAPGVALGLALAVGNRRVRKFWVVPAFLGGGVAAFFSALRVFLNLSPDDALTRGYLLGPFPNLDGPQRRFGFFLDSERFGFAADAIVGDAANANDANAGVFGTSFDPLLRTPTCSSIACGGMWFWTRRPVRWRSSA